MKQREIRKKIFEILFELEIMKNINYAERIESVIEENNLKDSKKEFITKFVNGVVENNDILVEKINENLKSWSFDTIGTTEKVILKMSFYEILFEKEGHQIAINEAIELVKEYGDAKSKDFINGILSNIVEE